MADTWEIGGDPVRRVYMAALQSLDEEITVDHLRDDFSGWDLTMEWARGKPWVLKFSMLNPGFAVLNGTFPLYCCLLESSDGTLGPDSARILAKARIEPFLRAGGDEVSGATGVVQVTAVCAPVDIRNRLFQYANTVLNVAPWVDMLFQAFDWSAPEKCLDAYSGYLYCDPVSHDVRLVDVLDSDNTYDLGEHSEYASHHLTMGQPPVGRARCTVQVEWTQSVWACPDISGVVNGLDGITTCNGSPVEGAARDVPDSYLSYAMSSGWKRDETLLQVFQSLSTPIATGNTWTYAYRNQAFRNAVDPNTGQSYTQQLDPTIYTVVHTEMGQVNVTKYYYQYLYYISDYRQPRRETATLVLDYPLQGNGEADTQVDLGVLKINDPSQWLVPNPNPPPEPDPYGNYMYPYNPYIEIKPWSIDTIYNKGDIAILGGQVAYKCNTDGYHSYVFFLKGTTVTHPAWDKVAWGAPLGDTRYGSFFDRPRGQACLQHAWLRLRAVLRARSEALNISARTSWEWGINIEPDTLVRMTTTDGVLPDGVVAVGKPRKITRHIGQTSGKTVSFDLGLPVGTGEVGNLPTVTPDPAVLAKMTGLQFYQQQNAVLQALGLIPNGLYRQLTSVYDFTAKYDQTKLGAYSFNSDIAWTYGAEPLWLPVDAFRLQDPGYAVVSVHRHNESGDQIAQADLVGMGGGDALAYIDNNPTSIQVEMRDIATSGVIERRYDCVGEVHGSRMGVNLSTGAEPVGSPFAAPAASGGDGSSGGTDSSGDGSASTGGGVDGNGGGSGGSTGSTIVL